jgi:predicted Rossmann-fold nucleotide-binding protein
MEFVRGTAKDVPEPKGSGEYRYVSERPELPVVGLIGPTNLVRISAASGIPLKVYQDAATEAGKRIAEAGAAIALVPDRGVALHGLSGYRAAGGRWVIGLLPEGGPSDAEATANCVENASDCHEIIRGFTWHHQHANICLLSDLFVCVGLSCGTLAEIVWTKWTKRPRVLAIKDTFTAIPVEILAETDVVTVGLDDLGTVLACALPTPGVARQPAALVSTAARNG